MSGPSEHSHIERRISALAEYHVFCKCIFLYTFYVYSILLCLLHSTVAFSFSFCRNWSAHESCAYLRTDAKLYSHTFSNHFYRAPCPVSNLCFEDFKYVVVDMWGDIKCFFCTSIMHFSWILPRDLFDHLCCDKKQCFQWLINPQMPQWPLCSFSP